MLSVYVDREFKKAARNILEQALKIYIALEV